MKIRGLTVFLPVLFMASILVIAGTGQKTKWRGTIEEQNGVIIVKSPAEPIYAQDVFNLEEDLTIKNEEGNEGFMFEDIVNLVVDEAGNIYVCDRKAAHLKAFDKNGKFLRTIGKRGQGPGEFSYPLDMHLLPQKEIMVNDPNQARISYFSLDGTYLRGISTSQRAALRRPEVDTQGNIVASYVIPGDEIKNELAKFTPDLKLVLTITTQPLVTKPPVIEYFESVRTTNLVWDVNPKDEIIWGKLDAYEIYVHNPEGKLIRKISREYAGVEITEKEKKQLIKNMFGDNPVPSSITLKIPKHYPAFIRFTSDEEGRIFVQSYEKTEDGQKEYYDVFDAEGKYMARISLKSRPNAWKNKKLYTIEEGDGFQVVKRYNVTWKLE